jgi:hypothetical protein
MPRQLVGGTLATALLVSVGAAAQTVGPGGGQVETTQAPLANPSQQVQLTPDQRTTILNAVKQSGPKAPPPVSFIASVGAPVPPWIELYMLPDDALSAIPAAKGVRYIVVKDEIVLVDPTTMRVVDVIGQ